jgi:type II secretory pathway component PulJ
MLKQPKIVSAFTLVELLLALVIVTLVSTAVTTMLNGAAMTSSFVLSETSATYQAETAYRRIMHNLRAASAISAPADTTAAGTLTLVTQPDSGNGNATYTVTYTLSGTNLTESDSRYNGAGNAPNVIATNVTAFSVTRQSLASPQVVLLTITIGTTPAVTRSAKIYCRNL